MPRYRCATCGDINYSVQPGLALTARQRAILNAVQVISNGSQRKTASTTAVAARVCWSVRTVRYDLAALEQMGEVARPAGRKSGWTIATIAVVSVKQLQVA